MNPLCSVLIPSRHRPDRLHRTIQSLQATALRENFEVVLKLDEDDKETIDRLPEFSKYGNVSTCITPRGKGYEEMGRFVTEAADIARGEWIFLVDDDATIMGHGWDRQLKEIPTHGVEVHPEFYWLNQSQYGSGSCVPVFICVPNGCWRKYGEPVIKSPADDWTHQLLVKNGWKIHFLKGITGRHDRDDDALLKEHRKL